MRFNSKNAAYGIATDAMMEFAPTAYAQPPPRRAPGQHAVPVAHAPRQTRSFAVPQQTTATCGDWLVQCVHSHDVKVPMSSKGLARAFEAFSKK